MPLEARRHVDRAKALLINRVLVVLVELQKAPGMFEGRNEPLQQADFVEQAEEVAKPSGMPDEGEEVPHRPGRDVFGQPRGIAADDFPGVRLDRLVVEIGQIDKLHDGFHLAGQPPPPVRASGDHCRAGVESPARAAPEKQGRQRRAAGRASGLGKEPRRRLADGFLRRSGTAECSTGEPALAW